MSKVAIKLTDIQRKEVIERRLAELSPEERKKVTFILPLKKPKVEGVRIIDPRTGRLGQSIFTADFPQTRFIVVSDPGVLAARRRSEEKKEERELAEKEAEFEAKRIERGLPVVPLERKGAAKILRKRLAEAQPEREVKKLRERKVETQREKVAKLIIAEQRARGTKAEVLFKQRRIEEQKKLGKIERKKPVLVQFPTAGGLARLDIQVFPRKIKEPEVVKPKRPLELFSPLARERLGIAETPERLLEIRKGERKVVVERGIVRAEIPLTAEFRTGFERQLGKREPTSLLREGGLIMFGGRVTTPARLIGGITKPFKSLEERVRPTTRKIFEPSIQFFEERELKLRRELRGRPRVGVTVEGKITLGDIRTIQLRAGQILLGAELGARRQLAEQPIETAVILGTGAALGTVTAISPALARAKAFKITSKVLVGAFAGVTGVQVGIPLARGRFAEAGEVLGERATEAALFVGGIQITSRVIQTIKPRKVMALKAKELDLLFAERLQAQGVRVEDLQKLGIPTKLVERVTRTRVRPFRRRIITPKTPEKLIRTLSRKDINVVFGLEPPPPGKKITVGTLIQDVPSRVRRFEVKPEEFKIRIDGKLAIEVEGVTTIRGVKGIERVIDPTKFIQSVGKGISGEKITILKRVTVEEVDRLPFRIKAGIAGRAKITEIVETKKSFANVFGVGLQVPISVQTTTTTIIGKPPILGVTPLITRVPLLLPPTPLLKIRERQDLLSGVRSISALDVTSKQIQATRQRQIKDVIKISDVLVEQLSIQKPIIDIARVQERTTLTDVISISRQITKQELVRKPTPRPKFPKLPTVPPPGIPFLIPRLFLGEGIKRKRRPVPKEFAFTPDFIASVLNQFGKPPTQRRFTGQERRFKVRGRRFVSPLPKGKQEGIVQLVVRQLGG